MKLVINVCFGGFGLSLLAEQEYLKRKGKTAYFYRQTVYRHNVGECYDKIQPSEENGSLFCYTMTNDLGDHIEGELPWKKCEMFLSSEIDRSDPDLVAVVEQMGEKANGQCASLSVVDIPDGVSWEISEYDGNEHIAEAHRTWC